MWIVVDILATTILNCPNKDRSFSHRNSFKIFNQKILKTMTIGELRTFPNCAHYSDEQAENIVRTLDKLATIIFDYTCRQYGIEVDNTKVKENENSLTEAA